MNIKIEVLNHDEVTYFCKRHDNRIAIASINDQPICSECLNEIFKNVVDSLHQIIAIFSHVAMDVSSVMTNAWNRLPEEFREQYQPKKPTIHDQRTFY